MFKRILIPLDGSPRAEQALPVAARLARSSGGSILLLQVIGDINDWEMYVPGMALLRQTGLDEDFTRARQYLAQVAQSPCFEDIEVHTFVLNGLVAAQILRLAHEHECDLLLLCSHGYSGLKRWALGSIAQKIAHYSPIPVLILREHTRSIPEQPGPDRPVRVLAALDGSPLAETVLPYAAWLSSALSAPHVGELHLARVIPFSMAFEYGQEDAFARSRQLATRETEAYFAQIETQLAKARPSEHILQIVPHIVSSTDTARSLLDLAEKGICEGSNALVEKSDIIALTTRGRSGLAYRMTGSTAERLLATTHLPLLIIHPPGATAAHRSSSGEHNPATSS